MSLVEEEPPSIDHKDMQSIGLCLSWRDQQKNVALFVEMRTMRTETIPRLLLAQFDGETITVYQAYKPSIGLHAARQGNFANSDFNFSRMTWIKPNFSWMMYRSGWASKRNQEIVLAIQLHRAYFDELLAQAVPTTWHDAAYNSSKEWSKALRESDVLVQWDPDHHLLSGKKLPYRVLQLGIRGAAIEGFKGPGIASVTDITKFVHNIRKEVLSKPISHPESCHVSTPLERRYPVSGHVQAQQRIS